MGPSADGPAPSKLSGSGAGDARFERLGRRCGVTCAEPSDSGCVASSSLIATSRAPPGPRTPSSGCTPAMGDEYFLFGDQQFNALTDYLQASLMLNYHGRNVG